MTPANAFLEWLTEYTTTTGYTVSRGMWLESDANSGKKYVSVWIDSGRAPIAGEVQYPQIRLAVAGRKNGRALGDTPIVEQYAHDIITAAIENSCTDQIVMVRPTGSIQGPIYTATDRPWYEINFELIT